MYSVSKTLKGLKDSKGDQDILRLMIDINYSSYRDIGYSASGYSNNTYSASCFSDNI
jgi:hypothetical protein